MTDAPVTDERGGLPSASGFYRVVHCPGSPEAERGCPEEPRKDNTTDQGSQIAEALEVDGIDLIEDPEAKEIAEALQQAERAVVASWAESNGIPVDEIETEREVRFWIHDPETLKKITSARLDVLHRWKQYALIIDHKTGYMNVTEAFRNWQLRVQGVAAWQKRDCTDITAAILQHRLSTRYSEVNYLENDLVFAMQDILFRLRRAMDEHAQRVPGEWCRWCKAKNACVEAGSYAALTSHGMPVEKKVDGAAIVERVQAMTPAQLAYVYHRKGITEKIFDAIKERLKTMGDDELAMHGLKRQPGLTLKTITDGVGATDAVWKLAGENAAKACIDVRRSKLEGILYEQGHAKTKKDAKAAVDEALEPFTAVSQSEPSIRKA